ncbi:DUF2637 domain-containing protein [Actinomadura gamaensis]|uniref:DUF2637 domain-containing protein n=1 Tax=Actinomadura gamaensis TaxID=1763541 RepID=A0ABV9UA76_9ACTN
MTDRLIRATTTLAVALVAVVAAVISYRHAYHLVRAHGETGPTARLVPLTVDGLIWAASMVILDARRRHRPVPALAVWSLGAGITATIAANLAHGLKDGPIGALIGAWPALALVGSYELLMELLRAPAIPAPSPPAGPEVSTAAARAEVLSASPGLEPDRTTVEHRRTADVEAAVLADYRASLNGPGRPASQRYLAQKHRLDRRRVKQIIDSAHQP